MSTRVFWSIGGRGGARQESRTILGVHHWLRGIQILSTLFFKCCVCWQRSLILTHRSMESSAKEQVRNEAIALVLKSDKWEAILQGAGWSKVRWGLGSLYECSSHLNYPRIRGRKALFPQVHTRVCPDEEAELIRSGLLCSFLKLKRAPGSNEGFCYQPQSPVPVVDMETWSHMRVPSQTNMPSFVFLCVHFSPSGCWRGKLLLPTDRKLWLMLTNVLKY